MPDIRLIATDIEGTLTNVQREIPPRTLAALQTLAQRGLPVVAVTGLNPWAARNYTTAISPEITAILQNGAFVFHNGAIIERRNVDETVARKAVDVLLARGYVPLVYGQDELTRYMFVEDGMAMVEALISRRPFQPYMVANTLEELFSVPPVQVSVCDTERRARAIYPALAKAIGQEAYVVLQPQPGRESWVEVNHPQARKDISLLEIAARLNIAPEHILYFGDSLNDREVMQAVGYPVAVENALPEIKALAWRIAPSSEEEGVAHTLAELFKIPLEP